MKTEYKYCTLFNLRLHISYLLLHTILNPGIHPNNIFCSLSSTTSRGNHELTVLLDRGHFISYTRNLRYILRIFKTKNYTVVISIIKYARYRLILTVSHYFSRARGRRRAIEHVKYNFYYVYWWVVHARQIYVSLSTSSIPSI